MRHTIAFAKSRVDERRAHAKLARGYEALVQAGDLCFDVGANIGLRTGALVRLDAQVVAVEPHPHCAAYLRRRFRRNVTVVEAALGAAPGETILHSPEGETTIATTSPTWIADTEERFPGRDRRAAATVRVTTFDQLVAEYGFPAFCKIDVEGSEVEVLRGMSTPPRLVSFEFVPERESATRDAVERLCALGVREFSFAVGESAELADWVESAQLLDSLAELDPRTFGDIYARVT